MTAAPSQSAVLIVDDVEATRSGLVHLLELQGFRAVPAGDGAEALDRLRSDRSICLVILDLAMPARDGYWFRDEQVKDPAIAGTPVVVFSGMPLDALPKPLAGVEVLAKPVALDRVIEIVARHCTRRPERLTA
ncbi:MAG: response regulator [Vicinamibacterales bacterium]